MDDLVYQLEFLLLVLVALISVTLLVPVSRSGDSIRKLFVALD